jgi:hypothetical protein
MYNFTFKLVTPSGFFECMAKDKQPSATVIKQYDWQAKAPVILFS